tara:strand:- start:179 stop:550 length:372 start_codon:yes stop_codon:yes gene_type:complete
MTVQYIGSSEDGTYGFMPSSQLDTNLPLSAVASKNDEKQSFYNKGANDEKLVVCIKSILPNASNEQIRNGGMGLIPGWDSLAQIQVMLEVERHFKQKFSSVDFETLKTYNGILTALKTHKEVL